MGGILSYFWGTSVPEGFDKPDATTGLTPRERKHVKDSWALVPNAKDAGIALFVKFFTLYPQHRDFFPSFKNSSIDQLAQNKNLRAHASNVIYAFTAIIDNLDDSEALVVMLQKIGRNHSTRNIDESVFDDLRVALLALFAEKFGVLFTEERKNAWDKTLTVAFKVICSTLDKDSSN